MSTNLSIDSTDQVPRQTGCQPNGGAMAGLWMGLLILLTGCLPPVAERAAFPGRRTSFIALTNFSAFTREPGLHPGQVILTSPEIQSPIAWNELVVSWNATPETALQVEARALASGWSSRFYNLGRWSLAPERFPRQSVNEQKDQEGEVNTDTLVLHQLASGVQVRLTLHSLDSALMPSLRFLGLSLLDNTKPVSSRSPIKAAWGKTLAVPEINQLDFANGKDWCSPASVSMVLAYWAQERRRLDWNVGVPDAARQIHDPAWGGTGNWSFNVAFAGSLPGLRAYVSRCNDLSEVEAWTAAGVPVILSVSFNLLNGQIRKEDTGHLIVCVGFTDTGDLVVNDPWAPRAEQRPVRRVCSRETVRSAWKRSQNTVYLMYPESMATP